MPAMRIATGQEVTEAIKHCGHSADLVDYCKERLEKQFKKAKLMQEPAIQKLLEDLTQLGVRFSKAQAIRESDIWLGVPPQSNQDIQAQLARTATLQSLSQNGVGRLKFRYALAEDGQFVRAFGIDGQAVKDPAMLQQLDDIVHKEFAKQHLSLNTDGRLLYVEDGKKIPANLAQMQAVCKGLEKTCHEQHIQFTAQSETYPGATPSIPKMDVHAKTASIPTPIQQTTVTPEAPSTGPGAQN